MALYDDVADLPLSVESFEFELRERDTSSGFTRATTTVTLDGDGETGRGEDVTYDTDNQHALAASEDAFDLDGDYTLDGFSTFLGTLDLFPGDEPAREDFRHYRQWAFESAALDLALRQADTNLGDRLGRSYDPVRFVVSTRLGDDPSADRVHRWLDIDPELEFKLDATSDWTRELVAELAATDRVRIVDLKGQYDDPEVEQPPDPDLYRRIRDGLPNALVEDPNLTAQTSFIFENVRDRITWDAPIVDVESIRKLPFDPDWLNVKPSRFGTVESLFDAIEYCERNDIRMYGGGQFELGVGRGQIQTLASLFYSDGPNDVAPGAYNEPVPSADVPSSPLGAPVRPSGFRWDAP